MQDLMNTKYLSQWSLGVINVRPSVPRVSDGLSSEGFSPQAVGPIAFRPVVEIRMASHGSEFRREAFSARHTLHNQYPLSGIHLYCFCPFSTTLEP